MDQQTFNMMFKGNYCYVDIKYNCVPGRLEEKTIIQNGINKFNDVYSSSYSDYKQVYDNAVIIHYATSKKPWKYTFVLEAKEWYRYYLKSPYKCDSFKLMGKCEFRINKYLSVFRKQGLSGVKQILLEYKNRTKKKKLQ